MIDITITAPISIRRPSLSRLELPTLGIGAAIAAISKAMGQAFDMAYVAPYRTLRQQPPTTIDADLQGRDPNW